MVRRKSRELCLQILFQKEFSPDFKLENSLLYFKTHHNTPDDISDYAKYLASGVLTQSANIDEIINLSSQNWKASRMSSVDLNILRMAVFEAVLAKEINAPKVVINEAIEIAKKYSSIDAASFINGILDNIIKSNSNHLKD